MVMIVMMEHLPLPDYDQSRIWCSLPGMAEDLVRRQHSIQQSFWQQVSLNRCGCLQQVSCDFLVTRLEVAFVSVKLLHSW